MQERIVKELWDKYVNREASKEEIELLFEYIRNTGDGEQHIEWLISYFKSGQQKPHFDEGYWTEKMKNILNITQEKTAYSLPPQMVIRKSPLLTAAAVLIAVIGISLLYYNTQKAKEGKRNPTVVNALNVPGNTRSLDRPVITLADGSTVLLDSVGSGQLALQGKSRLIKLADGRLVYENADQQSVPGNAYNVLTNPRSGKVVDIVLSDGTHVWLNTGSSIRYPVAFSDKERRVQVNGEAYFEVAHNAARPFFVQKDGLEIKVLGTHFNMNAYDDDPAAGITLLEGKVDVAMSGSAGKISTLRLKPGQQATVVNGGLKLNPAPDLSAIMAWRNGKFEFNGLPIQAVMRQIARWYNVEVVYDGAIPDDDFFGSISRDEDVTKLLHILEATGKVGFRYEKNKITVFQPKNRSI